MMSSGKVAFLALTYDTFQKHDVMSRFFNETDSSLYNLYIHNKSGLNADDYFNKFTIDDSLKIETNWGYHSLVDATLILLKEALKDKSNTRFILISDSHLPIHDIKTVCREINNLPEGASFDFLKIKHNIIDGLLNTEEEASLLKIKQKDRFYKMFDFTKIEPKDIPISASCAAFVSQWFTCDREAAQNFIKANEIYGDIFNRNAETISDESWFAVIANHYKIPYIKRELCFNEWDWLTDEDMISKGCKPNPHTFSSVTRDFIDTQRSQGKLFIRKVHVDTVIDEQYLIS